MNELFAQIQQLLDTVRRLREELTALREENITLRERIAALEPTVVEPEPEPTLPETEPALARTEYYIAPDEFVLTTNLDDIRGTDQNDVFVAKAFPLDDRSVRFEHEPVPITLNAGDVIDGGEGYDRLYVDVEKGDVVEVHLLNIDYLAVNTIPRFARELQDGEYYKRLKAYPQQTYDADELQDGSVLISSEGISYDDGVTFA